MQRSCKNISSCLFFTHKNQGDKHDICTSAQSSFPGVCGCTYFGWTNANVSIHTLASFHSSSSSAWLDEEGLDINFQASKVFLTSLVICLKSHTFYKTFFNPPGFLFIWLNLSFHQRLTHSMMLSSPRYTAALIKALLLQKVKHFNFY